MSTRRCPRPLNLCLLNELPRSLANFLASPHFKGLSDGTEPPSLLSRFRRSTRNAAMKQKHSFGFLPGAGLLLLLLAAALSPAVARTHGAESYRKSGGGIPGFPGGGIPGFPGGTFPPGWGGGWGYGGSGGSGGGVVVPSVVCKDRGPCYGKKLTCPAKCFSYSHGSGKHYSYGGGGGGCTMDCQKKCIAYC